MRKLSVCATLILLVAGVAFGQESQVEGDAAKGETPSFVRLNDLKSDAALLLKSQTSRERAWGAYLVGQHDLKEMTPALLELIADPSLGDGWEERIVRQAALDALIRLNAKVPADALRSLPANFSDEKIILMSRAAQENNSALLEMFDGELAGEAGPDARWLAVGNLLAETKAVGFAAALLRGLKIEAEITVVDFETNLDYGYGGNGGGGGGCGGVMREDFPPVGFYNLTAYASRGAIVVAPGKYPVYYVRTERSQGCGYDGMSYVRDFHRVEYLAGLLDTTTDELKFDSWTSHKIVCRDTRQCRSELAGVRREIEQSYAGVVGALVEKGLLDASDAATLPPNITFTLHDQRQKKTFPLPDKLKGVKITSSETESSSDGGFVEPPPVVLSCVL